MDIRIWRIQPRLIELTEIKAIKVMTTSEESMPGTCLTPSIGTGSMVGRRILTVTGLTVEIKRGAVPVAFLISRIVALLRLALILSLTSFYVCPVHAGDAVPVARWDFSTE